MLHSNPFLTSHHSYSVKRLVTCNKIGKEGVLLRPKSHLLYGEDTAAVHPLNLQKRAEAAVFLRWPQGGPTSYGYILQAVGAPWNYSAEL